MTGVQTCALPISWYITLLFGAGTGAVLVLRWFWERINLYSEVSAIIASLIFAPIILVTVQAEWLRLASMAGISTVVILLVTLLTRPTDPKILTKFYKQVKPPGFWRKTAESVGQDAEKPVQSFREGVYLTVMTSLSVFLLLVGFGKLIFPNPSSNIAYSWIYLVLGFASIPLWWSRVMKRVTG